jgi:hypothetical protein
METEISKTIILKTAVARAAFRSKNFLSAVLSSFCCSHETHPPGSNSHGCLTLHFAKNGNERRAKPLNQTLPTSEYRIIITLVFFSILLFAGCSSNIDKHKFSEIKAVGDTTLAYSQFGELLQKLTDEIARTKAVLSTEEEKSLLNSCEELLAIYQDSNTLWEYKVASSQYGWIPRGRIYMDAKVRTIAGKYQLPAESHVIELTNHHWESVSAESIRVIWDKAHDKLKKISL